MAGISVSCRRIISTFSFKMMECRVAIFGLSPCAFQCKIFNGLVLLPTHLGCVPVVPPLEGTGEMFELCVVFFGVCCVLVVVVEFEVVF